MMQFLHNAMWISIIVLFNWIYLIRGQTNQPKTNHELLSQIGYSYYFYQTPTNPRDCQDILDLYSSVDVDDAYYIRPVGFPQAFEAHCDPSDDGGGWTVIYRRHYGYIEFNRTWEEYKDGFGFLGSEFWIGNKKLAFLTNQRQYEIQLFIENAGGFSFYVHYNFFRISDERSNFKLVGLGSYTGNIESLIYHCPTNMVYGNCTCQPTCEDPDGSIECLVTCPEGEACICREGFVMKGGICVPIEECGCYIPGEGLVPKNRFHAQPMCISRCLCQANVLICGIAYGCSLNAACAVRNGIRKCYCNEGFTGDGQTCEVLATDCADIYDGGVTDSGVFTIKPTDWPGSPFEVYCDMTDGGGWTVFQRRVNGSEEFYLDWSSYKEGFGSPNHELWLGNEKIYFMTNFKNYQLRVDFVDSRYEPYFAKYDLFRINNEDDNYRLIGLGSYDGNAGQDTFKDVRNVTFSTYDRDNDGWDDYNCAEKHRSGWWFPSGVVWVRSSCYTIEGYCDWWPVDSRSCGVCSRINLNGVYNCATRGTSIHWDDLAGYDCNIKFIEMKLKPI